MPPPDLPQPPSERNNKLFPGTTKYHLGAEAREGFDEKLTEEFEDHHSRSMMTLIQLGGKTGNP